MQIKSSFKIWMAVVVGLFFVLYFSSLFKENHVRVKVAPLRVGMLTCSVSAMGNIKPSQEIIVRVKNEGIVNQLFVDEGDEVAKGQEIINLDSLNGLISIKSPIAGRVLLKPEGIENGVNVAIGQQLFTIGDIRKLVVKTDINEVEAKDIRVGQLVKITSDAYPGQEFQGAVNRVAPQIHEIEGANKVPVVIDILSPAPFIPGNRVDVEIVTDRKENAFYVPLEAVVERDGGKLVYFVENGKARGIKIKTGISNIDFIEIFSPRKLSENDSIIISNNAAIKDGMVIEIIQ